MLATAAAWSWRLRVVGATTWFVVRFLAGLTLVSVPIVLSLLLAVLLHAPRCSSAGTCRAGSPR